eukprot:symbB.v1.2.031096.t1/scaffold3573.1/size55725/1
MVVRCAGNIPKDIPSPAILAMQESTLHQRRQVASAQLKHQDKDPCTQPSEPILFPKHLATLKRVVVTPAVYPRLFEFHHFDIQSTGQKSHCANTF